MGPPPVGGYTISGDEEESIASGGHMEQSIGSVGGGESQVYNSGNILIVEGIFLVYYSIMIELYIMELYTFMVIIRI